MAADPTVLLRRIRLAVEFDQLLDVESVPVAQEVLIRMARKATTRPSSGRSAAAVGDKSEALAVIDRGQVQSCRQCALCESRTRTVFGQGAPSARLMFVGEAPGYDEDRQGLAFVGRAGQLLTKMIEAMGLTRDDVFICNVLKCRPPNNRTPSTDEIAACSPYLFEQIRIIEPEVICALGAPAAQTLLQTREAIGRLRGRFHEFRLPGAAEDTTPLPLMPTYHPAYLLRSPGEKAKAWDDLQMIMTRLGLRKQRV